jgi:TolA-binding protein
LPPWGFPLRLRLLPLCAALAACSAAPVRPAVDTEALQELRSQLQAQSSLVAQQQRRIEELEVKLAALAARGQPPQAPQAQPVPAVPKEPRPALKTFKMGEGRRLRRIDHVNPVERAPRLPATLELREPDEYDLARLDSDPAQAQQADADHAWALAVQKLNGGQHQEAEKDFLAFVAAHPRHTAADNALYFIGLVREVRGDCASALQLFESVPRKYPAGDAVPQALLERGRCLRLLGRKDEAKQVLFQLDHEHPEAPESAVGRQLSQGL